MCVLTLVGLLSLAAVGAGSAVAQVDTAAQSESTDRVDIERSFQPPPEFENKLGAYRSVMQFDDGRPVRTAEDWLRRRDEILKYWHRALGPWPPVIAKPQVKYGAKEHVENFTRHRVTVEVAPGRLIDTPYLLVPDGEGPFPAVLVVWYNAKDAAGLTDKAEIRGTRDFGYQLAKRGFVALCVGADAGRNVGGDVRAPQATARIQPLSYLAYTAANCCNALAEMPQVDPKRIGVVGHSFGGKWAMFASCLYERFACAVWSDPSVVWKEQDGNANYWEKWYLGYEFDLPPDRQRARGRVTEDNPRTGAYKRLVAEGRDLHELHALMAPRPFLVSGGAQDRPVHWIALNHAIAVNRLLGQGSRVAMTNRAGHGPTLESNNQVYAFLSHFLQHRNK